MHVVRREAVLPDRLGEGVLAVRVVHEPVLDLVHEPVATVALVILVEVLSMVQDGLHGPGPGRPGPNDGTLSDGHSKRAVEPAVQPFLVVVQVVGVVVDAGSALDLTDPKHFPGVHRDGLAGDGRDDEFLAHRPVLGRVYLHRAGRAHVEGRAPGQEMACVLDDDGVQDLLEGLAEHLRLKDPVNQD